MPRLTCGSARWPRHRKDGAPRKLVAQRKKDGVPRKLVAQWSRVCLGNLWLSKVV